MWIRIQSRHQFSKAQDKLSKLGRIPDIEKLAHGHYQVPASDGKKKYDITFKREGHGSFTSRWGQCTCEGNEHQHVCYHMWMALQCHQTACYQLRAKGICAICAERPVEIEDECTECNASAVADASAELFG